MSNFLIYFFFSVFLWWNGLLHAKRLHKFLFFKIHKEGTQDWSHLSMREAKVSIFVSLTQNLSQFLLHCCYPKDQKLQFFQWTLYLPSLVPLDQSYYCKSQKFGDPTTLVFFTSTSPPTQSSNHDDQFSAPLKTLSFFTLSKALPSASTVANQAKSLKNQKSKYELVVAALWENGVVGGICHSLIRASYG